MNLIFSNNYFRVKGESHIEQLENHIFLSTMKNYVVSIPMNEIRELNPKPNFQSQDFRIAQMKS